MLEKPPLGLHPLENGNKTLIERQLYIPLSFYRRDTLTTLIFGNDFIRSGSAISGPIQWLSLLPKLLCERSFCCMFVFVRLCLCVCVYSTELWQRKLEPLSSKRTSSPSPQQPHPRPHPPPNYRFKQGHAKRGETRLPSTACSVIPGAGGNRTSRVGSFTAPCTRAVVC